MDSRIELKAELKFEIPNALPMSKFSNPYLFTVSNSPTSVLKITNLTNLSTVVIPDDAAIYHIWDGFLFIVNANAGTLHRASLKDPNKRELIQSTFFHPCAFDPNTGTSFVLHEHQLFVYSPLGKLLQRVDCQPFNKVSHMVVQRGLLILRGASLGSRVFTINTQRPEIVKELPNSLNKNHWVTGFNNIVAGISVLSSSPQHRPLCQDSSGTEFWSLDKISDSTHNSTCLVTISGRLEEDGREFVTLYSMLPKPPNPPFSLLPKDILLAIFHFCSVRERTMLCLVCKPWWTLISSHGPFWPLGIFSILTFSISTRIQTIILDSS